MIYFIQAGENGPVKIGLAQDVFKRLTELQTGHYQRLRLIGVMDGEREQEKLTHKALASFRLNMEWFTPSPEVMEFVRGKTYLPVQAQKIENQKEPVEKATTFTFKIRPEHLEQLKAKVGLVPTSVVIRRLMEKYVSGEVGLD